MQPPRRSRRLVSQPLEPQEGLRRGSPPRCSEEDRIGALPDELLLELLARLGCLREAARTSVLSRRWRGLWTHLGDLTFDGVDPDLVEGVLGLVRPKTHLLHIRAPDDRTLSAARVGSLLRAAARLEPASLVIANVLLDSRDQDATFELPCFERAAYIKLTIGNLNFTLPPAGEFAPLQELILDGHIADPGNLLLRCPRLRQLTLFGHLRANTIAIRSNSLMMITLAVEPLVPSASWAIDIAAPNLKFFAFLPLVSDKCEFTLSILEPRVEDLDFLCITYRQSEVGFAQMWALYSLYMKVGNLVPIHLLEMCIFHYLHPPEDRSFEQEIARIPVTNFSSLELDLYTDGHVFGSLMSHLLRILTAIQSLKLVLLDTMLGECSEHCYCDEDNNWRDEPISLPHLEVVKIEGFSIADHEVDFLKFLFASAPALKFVDVELLPEVSSSNERCQELCSIFDANASVKCSVHDTNVDSDFQMLQECLLVKKISHDVNVHCIFLYQGQYPYAESH